jgi:flagellar hook-associated protein 3 FlgL
VQTSPTQRIPDGHSGFEVFQNVTEGNGTFVAAASAANTGAGVIDSGSLVDPAAWVRDDYTVRFTSDTTYDIVDSGNNAIVTGGTYTSGGTITFRGVQVSISGAVATGDEFSVDASGSEDMFTTLQRLVTTLNSNKTTDAETARFTNGVNSALSQLDRALDHVGSLRADVGARLTVLEHSSESRADRQLEMKSALSDLRDLDYAEAVTRLNIQMVGLQAAQQSYTQMSQLSLFDYLR